MKETIRRPVRVHTREIDRAVARHQMKRIGLRRVAHGTYFAEHWREYCVGGKNKKEDK